jgi:exopolysaccharide biosynthesis polyprenyl glycosylphosphotransferase
MSSLPNPPCLADGALGDTPGVAVEVAMGVFATSTARLDQMGIPGASDLSLCPNDVVNVENPSAATTFRRRSNGKKLKGGSKMVMASESALGRTVIPVGDWVMTPGETVSPHRVPRRMSAVLAPIPFVTDTMAVIAGFTLAGLPNPLLASAIVVMCLAVADTHRRRLTLSGLDVAPTVAMAAAIGAVLATMIVGEEIWLRDLLVPIGAAAIAVLLGRFVAYSLVRLLRHSSRLRSRAVIVGADAVGMALAQRMLEEPVYGLEPVLIVDDESLVKVGSVPDLPRHSVSASLRMALRANRIDAAVIAFPHLEQPQFQSLLADFEQLGYEIFVVPRLWEACPVSGGMDRIGAIPLMRIRNPMHRNPMRHLKLAVERCMAAIALLAVSPLLATVAGAAKLSHPKAPVLFRQTRVGLHGREFELLKFRSMTPATDLESDTSWTIVGDSRVDSLGRFLRASSIDELPQLWNIVRGDMALIGPRPERPHFVAQFSSSVPGYEARHRVPVGLTGWAAVNGLSGDTSITERARFDNFYITNWSLWFDIKIVLRTMWVLVARFRVSRCQEHLARGSVPNLQPLAGQQDRHTEEQADIGDLPEDRGFHWGNEPHEAKPSRFKSCDGASAPMVIVGTFDGRENGEVTSDSPADREDAIGAGRP